MFRKDESDVRQPATRTECGSRCRRSCSHPGGIYLPPSISATRASDLQRRRQAPSATPDSLLSNEVRHNQKMSQWQFGWITGYLQYKVAAEGISLQKVDEAYTTQTCPVCGRKKRTSSRNYNCLCGYQEHRDIHGAKNILTKYKYGEFRKISLMEHKYLRIA